MPFGEFRVRSALGLPPRVDDGLQARFVEQIRVRLHGLQLLATLDFGAGTKKSTNGVLNDARVLIRLLSTSTSVVVEPGWDALQVGLSSEVCTRRVIEGICLPS